MASNRYRQIYISFWSDPKIEEDFTPEDKYFYLYLLTNPYTNIAGCYEIGYKQMARGTGYNEDTVKRLIDRLKNLHKVIDYNEENKEILIVNWHKYNWSRSDNLLTGVESAIDDIKTPEFADYLRGIIEGTERVYRGSIDTVQTSVSVSVTDTVTDTVKEKKVKKANHPTVEEVAAYCKERNNNVDPEEFVDYYSSQNWKKANGQPLTDWKAGVRTFEKKPYNRPKAEPKQEKSFRELAKEAGWDVDD